MNGGLKELKKDERDIKFGSIFELPSLSEIPKNFIVAEPLKIKDQRETDYCSCMAGVSSSEKQEGVELDPLYQFMKTKLIEGNDDWGADLRSMAKSLTKFGSIEAKDSPFNIDTPREIILDPKNWPPSLDIKAKEHKKGSYAFVSGGNDFYDSILLTLWKNRNLKKTVVTGLVWNYEWTYAPQGIIDFKGQDAFGHAFEIIGQKDIKGKEFLVGQLSSGQDQGDNGLFYFSREVINQGERFSALSFTDLPKETVLYLKDNNLKISDLWFTKFWLQVKKFLNV